MMSLLDERMEDFVVLDKTTAADGYGGTTVVYQEGAPFQAVATQLQSQQLEVAYQDGQKRIYAIFCKPIVALEKGMRVKRLKDGLVFTVSATPDPNQTSSFSGISLARTTMEVITT